MIAEIFIKIWKAIYPYISWFLNLFGISPEEIIKRRKLLTIDELCTKLHYTRSYICNLIENEQIPYVMVKGQVRFDWEAIEKWQESKKEVLPQEVLTYSEHLKLKEQIKKGLIEDPIKKEKVIKDSPVIEKKVIFKEVGDDGEKEEDILPTLKPVQEKPGSAEISLHWWTHCYPNIDLKIEFSGKNIDNSSSEGKNTFSLNVNWKSATNKYVMRTVYQLTPGKWMVSASISGITDPCFRPNSDYIAKIIKPNSMTPFEFYVKTSGGITFIDNKP